MQASQAAFQAERMFKNSAAIKSAESNLIANSPIRNGRNFLFQSYKRRNRTFPFVRRLGFQFFPLTCENYLFSLI